MPDDPKPKPKKDPKPDDPVEAIVPNQGRQCMTRAQAEARKLKVVEPGTGPVAAEKKIAEAEEGRKKTKASSQPAGAGTGGE